MIKMRGVVAVPGEYTYGDTTEVKTVEELQDAAKRHPIVPLSYGHTIDGLQPTADMQIGTVSQKWSSDHNAVMGEFWLLEEKIPEKLRQKIDNGEAIPISAGIMLDSIDDGGIQRGITYTHIAIIDGEDPKCPLGVCGMNVRLESDRLVRLEKTTEIPPQEPKAEKEEEAPPEEVELVNGAEEAIASAGLDEIEPEQPKPEEPAEQKPEETDEQEPEEEVKLEPEVLIPAEIVTVRKEFEIIDGKYVFVPQAFKQKQEKEE